MESTRRLYHEDPELRTFRARVLAARPAPEGTVEVILDRTAFYPTGGGQPHDTGRLAGLPVIDVVEDGEEVLHRVRGECPSGEVAGEVDWDRRVDHRQQHSGQHVLSRAFVEVAQAPTVGFHLGAETCAIDLDREVGPGAIDAAEGRANEVVESGLPVRVDWYDRVEDLPAGLLKEAPPGGRIRVVSVGSFDAVPCCGTHCSGTGSIGSIKILRTERSRGGTRVEFVCGRRTLLDHGRRLRALRDAALLLTTEDALVPERVGTLLGDLKEMRGALERAEGEIRRGLLERWSAVEPGIPLARDLGEGRSAWLVPLAGALASRRGTSVLLGATEKGEARVVLALPEGALERAGDRIRALLAPCGGRGGGSERMGQGKLPAESLAGLLAEWDARIPVGGEDGETRGEETRT